MKPLPPGITIVPITEAHITGFYQCVDAVARERIYLGATQAFPLDETRAFVQANLRKGNPQLVALSDGQVIGWCDIIPKEQEGFDHCGRLGVGLLAGYRGQGIGAHLMVQTIQQAGEMGLERVELGVYGTNSKAIALYKTLGFVVEGVKRRARKCDGVYYDLVLMALDLESTGHPS